MKFFFMKVIHSVGRFFRRLIHQDPANEYERAVFGAIRTIVVTFGKGPRDVVR